VDASGGNVRGKLLMIVLVGLLLRVGWSFSHEVTASAIDALPDQREYLSLGRSLLRGKLEFFDLRFEQSVRAYRTPEYPMLIAACGGNVRAVQLVQALLDASVIFAVYLLARVWMSSGAALLAALIVALNPFLIFFSALILSETLFTAMLAWGMVVLIIPPKPGVRMICGGVVLAAAVMVRPGGILLPVILGPIAIIARPPGEGQKLFAPAATMVVLMLLFLFPWAARNKVVLKQWIWTSTNGGITEYDGFNPDADGSSNQSFVAGMPWLKEMGETERNDYLAHKAASFVRENPARAAELTLLHVARTWTPIPLSREYGSARNIAIGLLFSLPLDLLVMVGLIRGKIPVAAKWLLIAPALYLTVVHALSVGSLRYRLPAEAPMAVLAAGGVSYLSGRREQTPHALS
jgi:4-amino-4-deoxy-L-arabinose transferase-like glycosyltransferase